MALLNLLFGGAKKARIGVGDDDKDLVPIDASISESHSRSSQLTQSEIEDGSKITDHVNLDPIKVTLQGMITDSPVGTAQTAAGLGASGASFLAKRIGGELVGAAAAAGASLIGTGITKLMFKDKRDAATSFKFFEELWQKREPVTLVTSIRKYESMIITSLEMPRNKDVGKGFSFTVTLQELIIVASETTTINLFKKAPSVQDTANKAANKGKLPVKAVDNSTAALKALRFTTGNPDLGRGIGGK